MHGVHKASEILTFEELTAEYRDAKIDPAAMVPAAPVDAEIHINQPTALERERGQPGQQSIAERDRGKVLGRFLKANGRQPDRWCALKRDKGVPSILMTGATPEEQREFLSWRTPNMSLLGRYYVGVDCDANSPEAALVAEAAMLTVFGFDTIPIRTRSNSQRMLFVLKAATPGAVEGRSIVYRMAKDGPGETHKFEFIGAGGQFVATGSNLKGDYAWPKDADLRDIGDAGLIEVTNNTMNALAKAFKAKLDAVGGTVVSDTANPSGQHGEEWDYHDVEPLIEPDELIEALRDMPNTEHNFPNRNDLVSTVAKIKAALGCKADVYEDDIREWATADGWAEEPYFQKIWDSLATVRVERHALDHEFRKRGIYVLVGADFPDDDIVADAKVADEKWLADAGNRLKQLLRDVRERFHFRDVNTKTRDTETAKIRHTSDVNLEKNALAWWLQETTLPDNWIVDKLHEAYGKGTTEDWSIKAAFWRFQRDLIKLEPDSFFAAEAKIPIEPLGARIARQDEREKIVWDLNVIDIPKVQRLGEKLPRGEWKANQDVEKLLNLQRHVYGPHFEFELNSQAYMAQRKKRVGHWVFLVGDPGCGKSITSSLNSYLFNGKRKHFIPGDKLMKAEGARFAFKSIEGSRCFEIREIPRRMHPEAKDLVESVLKQSVDAGLSGDVIKVEPKGVDSYDIPNYTRIFATSNYPEAIEMAENDRRTFFVINGITLSNRDELLGGLDAVDELEAIIADPMRLRFYWRMLLDRDIESYNPKAPPPITFGKAEASLASPNRKPFARHAAVVSVMFWAAGREMFDSKELWHWMEQVAANERDQTGGTVDDTALYREEIKAEHRKVAVTGLEGKYALLRENMKHDGPDRKPVPAIYAHVSATLVWEELGPPLKPEEGGKRARANASKATVLEALADDRARHPIRPMEHLPGNFRPRSKPKPGAEFHG